MKAERYLTQEIAEIEVLGRDAMTVVKVKNLSRTGACVDWEPDSFQLEKGDLIRMTIELSNLRKSHSLNAEVVWSNGSRSGVHFLKNEELFQKMIIR